VASSLSKAPRLVAVGGATRKWKIDNSELARAIQHLQGLCETRGGSVIAVTSPRTTLKTRRRLEARLAGKTDALVESFPRFAVLLARCDEFYVTAESVSMLSEAVLTGKPVGMIPSPGRSRAASASGSDAACGNSGPMPTCRDFGISSRSTIWSEPSSVQSPLIPLTLLPRRSMRCAA